jgi:O-acetyl-ADP-ribose deacetylase (regulator of RNase III)
VSRLIIERKPFPNRTLKLIHGDLTEARVNVIINAANAFLQHGGGVAAAIVRKGGESIQRESNAWVKEHGPVTATKPALTTAGKLPCQFIIHAVGPIWGEGEEDAKLYSTITNAFVLADEHNFKSLALPAISTGIFGFPKERGANRILEAIQDYFLGRPESSLVEVQVVLIDQTSVDIFAKEFLRRWPESAKAS